jgi:hypothetical protein
MATFDLLVAQRDTILNLAHKHGAYLCAFLVQLPVALTVKPAISTSGFLEKGRSRRPHRIQARLEDCLHRQADVVTEEGCTH